MSSELKSETARINGAKSQGPVTEEGKARSSANSRKHGLTSAHLILPGESKEDFELLLADYRDQFQPQSAVEADLVEQMAISRWRLCRLFGIETRQIELEMLERKKYFDDYHPNMNASDRVAWAFKNLSNNGSTLTVILRYETTINRSYNKALTQLQQLQANRPVGSFGNPNKDSPQSEPPPPHSPHQPLNSPPREAQPEPSPGPRETPGSHAARRPQRNRQVFPHQQHPRRALRTPRGSLRMPGRG